MTEKPLSELSNRQLGDVAGELSNTGKLADPSCMRSWAYLADKPQWRAKNPGYGEIAQRFVALEKECTARGLEVRWHPDSRSITVVRVRVEEF